MLHDERKRMLPASPASATPGFLLSAPPETALALLSEISSAQLQTTRIRPSTGPPWVTSVLTTLVVVMGFALFVQHFSSKAAAQPSVAVPSTEPVPVKASPVSASGLEETVHPYAEFVKVESAYGW